MIVAPLKTEIVLYVYWINFEFSDARVVMCGLSNFFFHRFVCGIWWHIWCAM